MTIDDKLKLSHEASSSIHIFKEGLFAKMYNESAYLFSKHFVTYKVNVTTRKKGSPYFSVGFPLSILSKKFIGCTVKEVDKSYIIVCSGDFVFDSVAFEQWCGAKADISKELQQEKVSSSPNKSSVQVDVLEKEILKELSDFRLESVSPMECMLFISQIQKKLYGTLSKSPSL